MSRDALHALLDDEPVSETDAAAIARAQEVGDYRVIHGCAG